MVSTLQSLDDNAVSLYIQVKKMYPCAQNLVQLCPILCSMTPPH